MLKKPVGISAHGSAELGLAGNGSQRRYIGALLGVSSGNSFRPTGRMLVQISLSLVWLTPVCSVTDSLDGGAPMVIVVPSGASGHRVATAGTLQEYILQSTGKRLRIVASSGDGLAIHVGRSAYVDSLNLRLQELREDGDGFVLKRIDKFNYVIAGSTEHGTEFGVYEYLERFLGVRWLMPGEHGTDVPRRASVPLPEGEIRQEPAFFSRRVSGLMGEQQLTWARRLRLHDQVHFHHNLHKLFPPSRYSETHPAFFPILSGKRYLPKKDSDQRWQPDFSAAGLTGEAIRNITRYFREHPEESSYSLGINDSTRFDESRIAATNPPAKRNYLGMRDVSDEYFTWCNTVVEGVIRFFPGKRFGCLAYNNVAEPPSGVKLHPRIIPFMTYDRMQWLDPERRRFGEELTKRWESAATELGWYDYVYGSPYCVPRFYPHLMAEYLRFGRDHGVRAHTSEAYPNFGEGPKLYLHLKLLWDPDLDVDTVLRDWYIRCVGEDAAPMLADYFGIWERFWTQTVPITDWFRRGRQYLPFRSPDYLDVVREADVKRSRELLDACVEKTQTQSQRARAKLLRTAFEYYEDSVTAYHARNVSLHRRVESEESALAAINEDVRRLEAAHRRREFVRRYRGHPVLDVPLGWNRYPELRGDDWSAGLLWSVLDRIQTDGRVRERIETLTRHSVPLVRERAGSVLAAAGGLESHRLSQNTSFERDTVKPWKIWVKQKTGSIRRVAGSARTGTHALVCEGVTAGGPHQTIPIEPGRYLAVGYALVPTGQQSTGTVAITATRQTRDRKDLPTPQTRVSPAPGSWTPIRCQIDVPDRAKGKPVAQLMLIAIVRGFRPGEKVFLDDIALYRLPDGR